MSKPSSNLFPTVKGAIKDIIRTLPENPRQLLKKGWNDITLYNMKKNASSTQYSNGKA
jgi:hypothetical protein